MEDIEKLYELFLLSTGVTIDSRNILPGQLFFALKGENSDGNKFALQAIEKGALCAVIDNADFKLHTKCFLVDDALITLQMLAKKYRSAFKIPFFALTGSNGKTTTKELMHVVLNKKYKTQSTQGNLNNHIGVPLTILSLKKDCEIAVIEMGANHQKEIEFLCTIAQPTHGLITNIGKAHLEGFGGMDGVKKAKSELYRYLIQNNGVVFANSAHKNLYDVYTGYKNVIQYGDKENDFLKGKIIASVPFASVEVENMQINSKLAGQYNADNILAAACAGKYFNIGMADIKNAIELYVPENNRSEWREINGNHFILDAYNANPSSMQAAIENFMRLHAPLKILIMGDMLELGDYAEEEHASILQLAEKANINYILTVGPQFEKARKTNKQFHFNSAEQAKQWLQKNNFKGAHILVKGSRKIGLEKIV